MNENFGHFGWAGEPRKRNLLDSILSKDLPPYVGKLETAENDDYLGKYKHDYEIYHNGTDLTSTILLL